VKTIAEPARVLVAREEKSAVKEKKKVLTLGKAVSMTMVAIILIILYSPTIIAYVSSQLRPNKIELSFVPNQYGYAYTRDDLRKYGTGMTGVSGYAASIYISFQTKEVEIGDTVNFHVEIANLGNSLTKPYFYAFLVNNTGSVTSAFPQMVSLSAYSKLPEWVVNTQNGIDYWEPSVESHLLIQRQTLIAGQGDCWNNSIHEQNCEIWFRKQIADDSSQIGRWELWVFVSDETYKTQVGAPLSSQNAIAYTTQFFDVVPKAPQTPPSNLETFLLWLSRAVSFGFVILSSFGLFTRLSPWIDSHSAQVLNWWKRNRWILIGCVLLLIFYLILFLIGA
jgi:hypothetical protein